MKYHVFYSNSIVNHITELSNRSNGINPCTNPTKDSFVAAINNDDGAIGMDILTTAGRAFKRLEGCCSSLSRLLHLNNHKRIMDIMRLSIGTTIPHPSYDSAVNSTNDVKLLESLVPPENLAKKLQNRYLISETFYFIFSFYFILTWILRNEIILCKIEYFSGTDFHSKTSTISVMQRKSRCMKIFGATH